MFAIATTTPEKAGSRHTLTIQADIPPSPAGSLQLVAPIPVAAARAVLEAAGYDIVPPGGWVTLTPAAPPGPPDAGEPRPAGGPAPQLYLVWRTTRDAPDELGDVLDSVWATRAAAEARAVGLYLDARPRETWVGETRLGSTRQTWLGTYSETPTADGWQGWTRSQRAEAS